MLAGEDKKLATRFFLMLIEDKRELQTGL